MSYDTTRKRASLSADTCRLVAYSSWISGQLSFLLPEGKGVLLGEGLPRCYTPFVMGLHTACNILFSHLLLRGKIPAGFLLLFLVEIVGRIVLAELLLYGGLLGRIADGDDR